MKEETFKVGPWQYIGAGETQEQQYEWVNKHGIFSPPWKLKELVLQSIGLPAPKEQAENLILFGCYIPFLAPSLIESSIRLLDVLGVDYTYLPKEYCCGEPLLMIQKYGDSKGPEEHERAATMAKELTERNFKIADEMGVKNVAYSCLGCVYWSRSTFPERTNRHMYILDLIAEHIEGKDLSLEVKPTVAGYHEGCHSLLGGAFSDASVDWARYRRLLNKIEGLEIVDMKSTACCWKDPKNTARTVEKALGHNCDTIITPCNSCFNWISKAGTGKIQVKYIPEILLEGLGGS